ncbi:MAG: MltA domain-containing protein, partial [Proteobacteria bacterium]|nr:MltA domain-containing protein [Pseudomonadota bacterium]
MNDTVIKKSSGFLLMAAMFCLLAVGCATIKKDPSRIRETALKRIAFFYPEFADDMDYDGLEHGILQSILYLKKVSPAQTFRFGKDVYDTTDMIQSLEHFLNFIKTKPSSEILKDYILSNYRVYQSVGRGLFRQVFFTGYYEPLLKGRLEQSPEYRFPIYTRPSDLTTIDLSLFYPYLKGKTIVGRYVDQTVVPYYDRKEIEFEGTLKGKVRPIAWVKDPVDLFFLHIQGSGKIILDDDVTINVHYSAANGRPYRSIGKFLIDNQKILRQEMSMQSIRKYLLDHPEEIEPVLSHNPSYVFFKVEKEGPLGFLEVKLTPGRSIASDRRIFPLAGLAYIETQKPMLDGNGSILAWTKCSRFVLNQDTGGAIRGPGRA